LAPDLIEGETTYAGTRGGNPVIGRDLVPDQSTGLLSANTVDFRHTLIVLEEDKGPRLDDITAAILDMNGRVAAMTGKIGQPLLILPDLRERIAKSKIDL
jgi:hypothetical protein